ncbi:Kinesin motor domain containing protein [Histomonas meleagridis]|uniref:Kinesin motor domain containing protein n=1 Tax=Histomonas meleagridis TaxID=135588 RepID=UPI00355972AB|nr:Kinesin motor domain containing protein [Histomonas meleagridis]KAH0799020.1 Kinesin motor domain containing protein [Histomonas meleagridis]
MSSREAVKVAVRLRPMNSKEIAKGYKQDLRIDQKNASAYITNPQGTEVQFTYDFAFPDNCSQEDIYEITAAPIVNSVLEGYNGTIFAYGQTGTGKTFTMEGDTKGKNRGIEFRAFEHIFDYMTANSDSHKFSITATYVELYNEQVRDLLVPADKVSNLTIHEDPAAGSFYIKGVSSRNIQTMDDLLNLQAEGSKHRTTRATNMNEDSSRSHAILSIVIETLTQIEGGQHVRKARLNLVDLAGSERAYKTGAEGQGLKEGASINYALMILGNCISALTTRGHHHIPYRDSSLTKLLRDSLGGNAKTLMIATLGPADYNFSESLSTLRYAERAKKIENKPKVNMDPKDALLMKYQEELQMLQEQLKNGGNGGAINRAPTEEEIKEMEKKLEAQRNQLAQASHLAQEERDALQKKLDERKKKIELEKAKQSKFLGRLQELNKFLVGGSQKLMEQTKKNEEEINAIKEKLKKREERALQMEKELQEKKQKKHQMIEQCKTINEKVTLINNKFHETVHEYKNLKAKKEEVQKAFQEDSEQLALQIDLLNRQVESYKLILKNFVPKNEVKRIKKQAVYNKETMEWELHEKDKIQLTKQVISLERPKSAIGAVHPTAEKLKNSKNNLQINKVIMTPNEPPSFLKIGPRIINMDGIEEEIEAAFEDDDETGFSVDIPQELPGIASNKFLRIQKSK